MPYVRLGKSGLKVSKIILGCMSYGSSEWMPWALDEEEGLKHMKAAYDAGIQTFDTADVYSNGLAEIILGKEIKKFNLPRDEIVVMTKLSGLVARTPNEIYYGEVDPNQYGYVNQMGLSRKHIFAAVKHSLERLRLDYTDLLQCHRFDPNTPIEEIMHALHDIVKAGYVRYIGMSSCYAWQFHAMQNYAITHNLTPFVSMQNHYTLVYREEEHEMMPLCKYLGVGSIPWSPLARGFLTRPLGEQSKRAETDSILHTYGQSEGNQEINRRVEELAKKKGKNMAQIALAWVMNKKPVSAPVVGTTNLQNLLDLIDAVNLKLTRDEMKYLEEPYKPMPIVGLVPVNLDDRSQSKNKYRQSIWYGLPPKTYVDLM